MGIGSGVGVGAYECEVGERVAVRDGDAAEEVGCGEGECVQRRVAEPRTVREHRLLEHREAHRDVRHLLRLSQLGPRLGFRLCDSNWKYMSLM